MPNNKPIQGDEELRNEIDDILGLYAHFGATDVMHYITKKGANDRIMKLIKAYSLQEQINEAKLYMKSYPKKNRTMNDLSKMTRAELDRHITDLKKELEALK